MASYPFPRTLSRQQGQSARTLASQFSDDYSMSSTTSPHAPAEAAAPPRPPRGDDITIDIGSRRYNVSPHHRLYDTILQVVRRGDLGDGVPSTPSTPTSQWSSRTSVGARSTTGTLGRYGYVRSVKAFIPTEDLQMRPGDAGSIVVDSVIQRMLGLSSHEVPELILGAQDESNLLAKLNGVAYEPGRLYLGRGCSHRAVSQLFVGFGIPSDRIKVWQATGHCTMAGHLKRRSEEADPEAVAPQRYGTLQCIGATDERAGGEDKTVAVDMSIEGLTIQMTVRFDVDRGTYTAARDDHDSRLPDDLHIFVSGSS